jgi:hypothetical protein
MKLSIKYETLKALPSICYPYVRNCATETHLYDDKSKGEFVRSCYALSFIAVIVKADVRDVRDMEDA